MLYINNMSVNPYFNHALEEYFLKQSCEECFILWRSSPCVLIGKNQNAFREININYVQEHKLSVVRRLSGGGAIFNDLGNVLFGFISNDASNTFADFERFTTPIISALNGLGVHAQRSGRNDITIDGKKISGNAQARHGKRILHHGSLLYSSNMSDLVSALNVKPIKLQDKGIQSVASRVTNISEHMNKQMDVVMFKDYILDYIIQTTNGATIYELTETDRNEINNIMEKKTATWEWNFGQSPKYTYQNEKKFTGGIVEVNLNVTNGIITDLKIYGDFFGQEEIMGLEQSLIGVKHDRMEIEHKLKLMKLERFMTNVTTEELAALMLS